MRAEHRIEAERVRDPERIAFAMTQAAQRFLLDVVPLREPGSTAALDRFSAQLPANGFGRIAVEATVVTVLRKLGASTGVGEMLLSRYFALEASTPRQNERLRMCVEGLLRLRGVRHPAVAAAIELIDARYADSTLRLGAIARELCVSSSHLAHLIAMHTGRKFRAHLQDVRMREAAGRLAGTATIQAVAASVGYAHAADFNHHFKKRFGVTPSGYRSRQTACGVVATPLERRLERARPIKATDIVPRRRGDAVLIVEDDQGTRETFATILRLAGYFVRTTEKEAEAWRLADQFRLSVVIADRWMGKVDGIDLARELARRRRIPIVLLTGDLTLEAQLIEELERLGVQVAFKPLDIDELLALVERYATPSQRVDL
jgi:AraC-like DNA-binding protein/CheY-like chemotaxis protein